MNGLKIGLIGPLPPPSGGMANQTRQLADLLRSEGAVVELVQTNPPYPRWIAKVRWIRAVFRLPLYLLRLWRVAGRVQLFHVMANSGWSWHLVAVPAIWMGKLGGAAVVVNYRGGAAEEFLQRSGYLVKLSLLRTDALVVPSGFLERVFARRGLAATIVPNIIDLTRFCAHGAADRIAAERPPHVIVTRNLELIYDIGTAVRAFAMYRQRFPAATLTIAGSGPEGENLKALATSLGLGNAVTFTGQLDNARMVDLYSAATILLNPSLVDNMPISVLEALASGVPVVSTNVGGVPYMVQDGQTALLVPPARPEKMADALSRLSADKGLARRLSEAGQTAVQVYSWQHVRQRLAKVYMSVTSRAKCTTAAAQK